jgi:hypothetical protein
MYWGSVFSVFLGLSLSRLLQFPYLLTHVTVLASFLPSFLTRTNARTEWDGMGFSYRS